VLIGGKYTIVPFWCSVKRRAEKILGRCVIPGDDYAVTEIVHCKSVSQIGVSAASHECSRRYLSRVLNHAAAKVIVVLGADAGRIVKQKYGMGAEHVFWAQQIEGRKRSVVFLPHPNARAKRKCADHVTPGELMKLRQQLQRMPWKTKPIIARNASELARVLGLTRVDAIEMELRCQLNDKVIVAMRKSRRTLASVAKAAGTSPSQLNTILNRNRPDVSISLMLRILFALGYRLQVRFSRVRRAA